jgi:phosphoglycolate phosphatase-like HAD superfamily hydrolase
LTLLTGNLEALAHAKVHSAGIGHFFRLRGAYGSDAEDRNQLPAIAAQRVGDQLGERIPPGRMIIIGDTPRDIECARHFGVRVVAVASGFHSREQLRPFSPDALLRDFGRTREVVRMLSGLGLKRGR